MEKCLLVLMLLVSSIVFCFAEGVPVRYDGKVCKMEILSSVNKNSRSSKDLIKKDVLTFCKDKYIYNVQVAADKGIVTYVIFYNDKNLD